MKTKVGVLFSGGKDSCLALHKAVKSGLKVDCLLSLIPENKDSYMFHKPDVRLLKKQAEMLGINLMIEKTKGIENKELLDLKKLIKKSKVDKLIIGGIKSSYQGKRIKKICSELRVEVVAPLWGCDEDKLWQDLLNNGFEVMITKVSCEGLGKEWLGRIIDKKVFQELFDLAKRYRFNLSGEGGEFETTVLYCPLYTKKIKVKEANVIWERNSGVYFIKEVDTIDK